MKALRTNAFGVLWLMALLTLSFSGRAATFVVTNTLDSGPGSFREALTNASLSPGVDVITFSNVSGLISLLSPIPTVEDTEIIGPGARQLTINTPHMVVGSGRTTTISNIRMTSTNLVPTGTFGGIISNGGSLFLRNCEFSSTSMWDGRGTAIYNAGDLSIEGSTFVNNKALSTRVIAPSCDGLGGAIYFQSGSGQIINSTFSGNHSDGSGECTASGRVGGIGGAVYVKAGNLSFVNCTFTGNSAGYGGAIYSATASVNLLNTIVTDTMVGVNALAGNNLIIVTNAAAVGLGPLQDNGGPTLTHALAPNSPAINRGTNAGAPIIDQRGVSRPQAGRWDIGAVEFVPAPGVVELDTLVIGPGTISRYPDLVLYPSNTIVTIMANMPEDYLVSAWSGDAAGDANPLSITMDRDKSIVANVHYAPYTVTNRPGTTNYVVNTNGLGPGSLRQALRDLNASGGGVIRFSNVSGTITLPLGLPPLLANLQIYGSGSSNVVLSLPPGVDRFTFRTGVTGIISGMTIYSPQPMSTRLGGAISNAGNLLLRDVQFLGCSAESGGAIYNRGILQVEGCAFNGNRGVFGGAVYNEGDVRAANSAFSGNSCYAGLGSSSCGGAFLNETGQVNFAQCSFTGNSASGGSGASFSSSYNGGSGYGGAIYVSNGKVGLLDTLLSSNSTRGGGAGSYSIYQGGSGGYALGAGIYFRNGMLAATNCAFVGNAARAGDGAGAIRYGGAGGLGSGGAGHMEGGDAFVMNCTLFANEAQSGASGSDNGFGGGLPQVHPGGGGVGFGGAITVRGGTLTLANSTITGNFAWGGQASGIFGTNFGSGAGGGIYAWEGSTVALLNSIVFGNFVASRSASPNSPGDFSGPGSSLGYNLFGAASSVTNVSSDRVGLDPRLGPIQDNGGRTPSHALLAGSPAIDAGAPALLAFDQRGQPRTIDDPAVTNWMGSDGTDIGAVESNPRLTLTEVRSVGTNVQVRFTTVSDRNYQLQYKSELTAPSWITLPGTATGSGGIVTATNLGAGVLPRGFYRAFQQ